MEYTKSQILQTFDDAILAVYVHSWPARPGQAYLKLPAEKREILSQLKSDHIKDVRVDWLFGEPRKGRKR